MRIVYNAANIIDAHLVRHALEQEDIPAFVQGEALVGGVGELPAVGLVSVAVPDSAWQDAIKIVAALGLGTGFDDDDEADLAHDPASDTTRDTVRDSGADGFPA